MISIIRPVLDYDKIKFSLEFVFTYALKSKVVKLNFNRLTGIGYGQCTNLLPLYFLQIYMEPLLRYTFSNKKKSFPTIEKIIEML